MRAGGPARIQLREFAAHVVEGLVADPTGASVDDQPGQGATEGRTGVTAVLAQVPVPAAPATVGLVGDEFDDGLLALVRLVGVGDVEVEQRVGLQAGRRAAVAGSNTIVVPSCGR